MSNFKEAVEKWAEEVLAKSPKQSFEETANQVLELRLLGSLLYDDKGNWIPYFNWNEKIEVKPVKVKNGKIVL